MALKSGISENCFFSRSFEEDSNSQNLQKMEQKQYNHIAHKEK